MLGSLVFYSGQLQGCPRRARYWSFSRRAWIMSVSLSIFSRVAASSASSFFVLLSTIASTALIV